MCYERIEGKIAALCQERDTLNRLLKEAKKSLDKMEKENSQLKEICERQARMNRAVATTTLQLDTVIAERDALKEDNLRLNEAYEAMSRDIERVYSQLHEARSEMTKTMRKLEVEDG